MKSLGPLECFLPRRNPARTVGTAVIVSVSLAIFAVGTDIAPAHPTLAPDGQKRLDAIKHATRQSLDATFSESPRASETSLAALVDGHTPPRLTLPELSAIAPMLAVEVIRASTSGRLYLTAVSADAQEDDQICLVFPRHLMVHSDIEMKAALSVDDKVVSEWNPWAGGRSPQGFISPEDPFPGQPVMSKSLLMNGQAVISLYALVDGERVNLFCVPIVNP